MYIKHYWDKDKISKKSDDSSGFLLTNKIGGYLSLSSNKSHKSRYCGWFFAQPDYIGQKLFKVIEDIKLIDVGEVLEIKNNFWNIERNYKQVSESFFIPKNYNSIVYELSKGSKLELFLDARESYDNQKFGRFYEITEENGVIIIKCINNNTVFYLAIKSNKKNYSKIGDWLLREYQYDKNREALPFKRYVYRALGINAKKIVFSVNFEKEKAIKEANEVFKQMEKLKKVERERIRSFLIFNKSKFNNKKIELAYLCAKKSLDDLTISDLGIYAGLPWFFQFWPRDELISLLPLNKNLQKRILLRQFNNFSKIYDLDAVGWLLFRAGKFIKETNDLEIKKLFFELLEKFQIPEIKLTWMDTLSRLYGIDLYALKLQSYKLAYQCSGDIKFIKKEKELVKYVRDNFWNGKILADTPNNFIIRSNVFLVAYIYPDLLSKKEWIICFENSLSKLWLGWGGVTTVDKTSSLFISKSTGHNPKSYHNGDSWFWINNLTALVLFNLDKKRFKQEIKKILETSTNEILWKEIIGHHTEISSANNFKSEGCWSQAWSSALYIELVDFLFKR